MDNFTLTNNFYEDKVNEVMDSTSNIFFHHSPLFQSLNSDRKINKHSRNNDRDKFSITNLKTARNFRNVNILKKISFSLSPSIEDKEKLTSYYKTTTYYNDNDDDQPEKKVLFHKYKISNIPKINLNIKKQNTETTFNLIKPFFNSLDIANKVLNTNKQIIQRISEMTHYFQIEKYNKNISKTERNKYLLKKMPRIQVKSLKSEEDIESLKKLAFKKDNIKKKSKSEKKEEKPVNKIPMNLFRRMSFNGMLATNYSKNKSLTSNNKHQVNAIISFIKFAYKPRALGLFSVNVIDNKVYLYGGLSTSFNNDIWCYDIAFNKWEKIKCKNSKNDEPVPRFGHSSIIINNNLIIFGGETPKNNLKPIEDLIVYNIENKKFTYPRIKKGKIAQRKGHICIPATYSMLIYGGINLDTSKIENTAYIFNAKNMTFTPLDYIGDKLPSLIYHNGIFANHFNHYTSDSFSFYELPLGLPHNRVQKIKIEGIYIFGGLNEKYQLNNKVYLISVCKKPCIVFKPKIDGIPPEPRYNSKMVFIEDYNFIVISGGIGRLQRVLNDLMILNIESLNWIKPIFEPENYYSPTWLIPRTEHEMFFNNGKIYILGGRNENNYCNMDFECVQFEITNF